MLQAWMFGFWGRRNFFPPPSLSFPLILHLILTFTSPTSSSPLLVSSLWYQTFIPILYHTPVLRSQPDIHNLFFSSSSSASPHPNLKPEALFHVRKLVLLVGETPPASPSAEHGELERWRNAQASRDTNWLPRLEELQLGWGREGLRELGAGLVSMVDGRGHSLAGEVGRLLRVVKPKRVVFQPTAWGCIEGGLLEGARTETHVLLHPATLTRLQTLFQPLFSRSSSSSPPTSLTYSHLFLHELSLHQPWSPRPAFLLPAPSPSSSASASFTLNLNFAPLSSLPTQGDHGLSLNPWDRRVSIVRQACLAVGPNGKVSVRGVSKALREELRMEALRGGGGDLEGRVGSLEFEEEDLLEGGRRMEEEERREVPDLTPTQLHALFYTTPMGQPGGGGGFWPNSTSLSLPVVLQAAS
ncbi:hypothetical protein BDY24DRAFT_411874 [Mrakia frigida]|uniref:uncharacterized protein n=1 Tax=Mrakia frigida TaxID=29902 RepID=UPI003FCC24AF